MLWLLDICRIRFTESLCFFPVSENDITGVLDHTFCVEHNAYGEIIQHELKPNGKSIPVTEENKKEYVRYIHIFSRVLYIAYGGEELLLIWSNWQCYIVFSKWWCSAGGVCIPLRLDKLQVYCIWIRCSRNHFALACRLYVNWRFLRGIEAQFLALQKGFNEVIPQHLLKTFDEKELEVSTLTLCYVVKCNNKSLRDSCETE